MFFDKEQQQKAASGAYARSDRAAKADEERIKAYRAEHASFHRISGLHKSHYSIRWDETGLIGFVWKQDGGGQNCGKWSWDLAKAFKYEDTGNLEEDGSSHDNVGHGYQTKADAAEAMLNIVGIGEGD